MSTIHLYFCKDFLHEYTVFKTFVKSCQDLSEETRKHHGGLEVPKDSSVVVGRFDDTTTNASLEYIGSDQEENNRTQTSGMGVNIPGILVTGSKFGDP